MTVTFNVSNNDVAFRYTFDGLKAQHIIINEEKTAFNLPKISTSFLCPQSDPLIGFARTKPSYEEDYKPDAPLTAKSGYGQGYTFPCLFKVGGDGWVLVSETGTHGNYPAVTSAITMQQRVIRSPSQWRRRLMASVLHRAPSSFLVPLLGVPLPWVLI